VAGCDFGDGDGVLLVLLGVADGEGDARLVLDGVGRLVGVGGVNRLEAGGLLGRVVDAEKRCNILLAQEVAEVGDGVLGVANELALGLPAVELLTLYVREDRGDLAVTILVGNDLSPSFLWSCQRRFAGERVMGGGLTPEVKAMDEYEFPKEGGIVRPVGVFSW
jgi:hypothetical protein